MRISITLERDVAQLRQRVEQLEALLAQKDSMYTHLIQAYMTLANETMPPSGDRLWQEYDGTGFDTELADLWEEAGGWAQ